ncbi:MAG: S-layer glycoprotein N-glycosyltransferase AglJ [Methanomicrobiaceae archaeon]|nr:S-layer glycoprotein N-glycosyltransferase AglJ [Methanomicrobiaceae archaeon]
MEIRKDEVCVLIPTLNEAPTIGSIIEEFQDLGYPYIFIIDGNSGDKTVDIAKIKGARVEVQTGRGKGNAVIEALGMIEHPYILMIDGDGTYAPEEADRMLAPLFSGADQVIGNRLHNPDEGALTRMNGVGNRIINYLFKVAHGTYLADILSGYRAFTLSAVRQMHLKEGGFGIETEMAAEAVRNNQKVAVVPVSYSPRPGTETKLSPVKDGFRIMATTYRLAKMTNPLFYFGIAGCLLTLFGGLIGVYVVWEWVGGTEHLPLTILTVLLIVVGFELFMFGVISDMILTFHREIVRELQRLRPPENQP